MSFAVIVKERKVERLSSLLQALNNIVVGLGGLEPPTSRLSGVYSNQLSYKPIIKTVYMTEIKVRFFFPVAKLTFPEAIAKIV